MDSTSLTNDLHLRVKITAVQSAPPAQVTPPDPENAPAVAQATSVPRVEIETPAQAAAPSLAMVRALQPEPAPTEDSESATEGAHTLRAELLPYQPEASCTISTLCPIACSSGQHHYPHEQCAITLVKLG